MLVKYMFRGVTNSIYLLWVVITLSPTDAFAQEIESILTNSDIEIYQMEDSLKIEKSPRSAMYRSLFVPGWGQWYNGKKIKSIVIFAAETSAISAIFIHNSRLSGSDIPEDRSFHRDERNKFFWWLGGVIGYSVLDAYVDAYLQDFSVDMDINKEIRKSAMFRLKINVPF